MHRRIMGTEFEYGVFSWDLVPRHMKINNFLQTIQSRVDFMPAPLNGARLYVDMQAHPEYCTPECRTPREVVLHEKAGELILEEAFRDGIPFDGPGRRNIAAVRFYRSAVDNRKASHGYHENYLVSRQVPIDYLIKCLIPFLVTRVIYAGSGNIRDGFEISGRARYIENQTGENTVEDRPIINLRDEPLADGDKYRRLHLIVGDPNMSEYATYLKIGATSLVLDLIEDGFSPDIRINEPVDTLRRLARTPSDWELELQEGGLISAVNLQRMYLDAAKQHYTEGCRFDDREMDEETWNILEEWEAALDGLEREPLVLADTLDWAAEKKLIDAQMKRHEIQINDPLLTKLNLRYHETGGRSVFYALQKSGHVRRLLADEEIERARHEPPHTRAKGRSLFLKEMRKRNAVQVASADRWQSLAANDKFLSMPNPFETYEREVHEMFGSGSKGLVKKIFRR